MSHIGKISPTNMYIWEPYEQILGIYPIRVLNGPYIGFFAHITHTGRILIKFDNYKNKFQSVGPRDKTEIIMEK